MKSQIFKLIALIALLPAGFSCTGDSNDSQKYCRIQWDGSEQQEEFRPINPRTKSSSFAIDGNIISFAVPYLVGTIVTEHLPIPGWGSSEGLSPHFWTITLFMAEKTDVTKLAPIITLAPNVTITNVESINGDVHDFSQQVDYTVIAPDGSTVKYKFSAVAIGDYLPCANCPGSP